MFLCTTHTQLLRRVMIVQDIPDRRLWAVKVLKYPNECKNHIIPLMYWRSAQKKSVQISCPDPVHAYPDVVIENPVWTPSLNFWSVLV